MELISILRNIVEIGFGLLFLVGAIFNVSYTLRHGEEFYGSFATSAWFGPSRRLVRSVVIPHARLFTVLLLKDEVARIRACREETESCSLEVVDWCVLGQAGAGNGGVRLDEL